MVRRKETNVIVCQKSMRDNEDTEERLESIWAMVELGLRLYSGSMREEERGTNGIRDGEILVVEVVVEVGAEGDSWCIFSSPFCSSSCVLILAYSLRRDVSRENEDSLILSLKEREEQTIVDASFVTW